MSVTGSPFLATHIRNMFADSQRDEEMSSLLKIFDDITVNAVTPLAKAQYKLLKEWLENPQENTAEALLMFASVPGSAGMPLPDGGLGMWLPMAHFVRRIHSTCQIIIYIYFSTPPVVAPSYVIVFRTVHSYLSLSSIYPVLTLFPFLPWISNV